MKRELTGRHVLVISVAAFGVIILANLAMLFAATGTFPGLVVRNSYVASQGWNARTDAQRALDWTATVDYAESALKVTVLNRYGQPASASAVAVTVGRRSTDAHDQTFRLDAGAMDHVLPIDLAPGAWRVTVEAGDPAYQYTSTLFIPGQR